MHSTTLKMTGAIMSAVEKVIKAKLTVEGLEHLLDNPTLFVVNHFTRIETFLIPYVLQKYAHMDVRSLASSYLFKGLFGEYLLNMGTMSIREPQRNQRIISDLLTGASNWVIYPEGVMVKNKHVFENGQYRLRTPTMTGPLHTGSAVFSLRTEIAKREYLKAVASGDNTRIRYYQRRFFFNGPEDISPLETVIVPVNITYYPLRPGKNLLSDMASLFFKELPKRLDEELKTEGKLLFSDCEITIYFGRAIHVGEYVKKPLAFLRKYYPLAQPFTRERTILNMHKKPLTRRFSDEIYRNVTLHIDHLFCMGLRQLAARAVRQDSFHKALYLSALQIRAMKKRRTHSTLREGFIKCITDEVYEPLENITRLAEKERIIRRRHGLLIVNHRRLENDDMPFHNIRLKNITTVIANEVEPLKIAVDTLHINVNLSDATLRRKISQIVYRKDCEQFEHDYHRYYDEKLSKPASIGRPLFLPCSGSKAGVVLIHGYLAAPEEMREMASYLHDKGFSVYVARLAGMGTAPRHLADVTWQDWVHSVDRAYAVIRNSCERVHLVGFSAGGLLALLAAAGKSAGIDSVVAINTPLILQSVSSRLVPTQVAWNAVLDRIHLGGHKLEYVTNHSDSPDINYSQNYLKGVRELKRLIYECRRNLRKVKVPTLIIQSTGDAVVNPASAEIIHEGISSERKEKVMLKSNRHIIVRGEGTDNVFARINRFISR